MRLITIDPGHRGLGWAVFDERLIEAGILENVSLKDGSMALRLLFDRIRPDRVVIEVPQVYPQRAQKGDPNDLIDVAVIAGLAAAAAAPYVEPLLVRPRVWKGNRPKDVDNAYTVSILDVNERKVVQASGVAKSKMHNVLDAVGIGLWRIGRR